MASAGLKVCHSGRSGSGSSVHNWVAEIIESAAREKIGRLFFLILDYDNPSKHKMPKVKGKNYLAVSDLEK